MYLFAGSSSKLYGGRQQGHHIVYTSIEGRFDDIQNKTIGK